MNSTRMRRTVLTALAALALPGAANALPPGITVLSNNPEVPDPRLAEMRGRYISGSSISYFGVEMLSQWQTAAGDTLSAGLEFNVDLAGMEPQVSFSPTVAIVPTSDGTSLQGQTAGSATVQDQGTGNAGGVVQVIQTAGDANAVAQDVSLDVQDGPAPTGGTTANGSNQQVTVGDASAMVRADADRLETVLSFRGQGEVVQSVGSSGVHQATRLVGDLNQVQNVIRLSGYGTSGGTAGTTRIRNALDEIRDLSAGGIR
ncbi:MAG TPA: hypothetical protein VKA64_06460 [Gammaproteobacteria bacterium]|nr:hypothetical protein [Gammaproteobacteria bacterium]